MSQNRAEDLDDDKVGGEYPPEEPLGVEEYGTTPAEEAHDEPLVERLAREEPEVTAIPDPGVDLMAPADQVADVEAIAVPDLGEDAVDDVVTEHEAPVPAEEAAIHEVPEP